MGQYYKPALLAKNKKTVINFLTSWAYSKGSKLMEHSWLGNDFVRAFESLIHKNPQRVVWGGDYADECKGRKTNIYQRCLDKLEIKPVTKLKDKDCRFIVNHDKKLFVDTTKVPVSDTWTNPDNPNDTWTYKIHPLPLLTCEGNGRGGGDFGGDNQVVGTWARDLISVEPVEPKGYIELHFNLVE
jgi:hypothetical protein